jgi:hypothetical protein
MIRLVPLLLAGCLLAALPAFADAPPSDAQPLSQILQTLEQQGDVAYFDEVDRDDDGYWEIEYVNRNGAEVEIKLDPVSGQPRR